MKHIALFLTLAALILTLTATGCSTTEQRARADARANDHRGVITHQDRESNFHN